MFGFLSCIFFLIIMNRSSPTFSRKMSLLCYTCSGYGGWFVVSVEFICFLDIFLVKGSYIYVALIKQDSPEVHANAAEILSAVTRCAPPALATKICSTRFVLYI